MTIDLTRLVKPLEWRDFEDEQAAENLVFAWRIYLNGSSGLWNAVRTAPDHERIATQVNLAAAQAAANADNVTRSLTAIDTALVKELVEAADSLLTSCRHFYHGSAFEKEFEWEIAALAKMNGAKQ